MIADEAQARGNLYQFLAAMFLEAPRDELFERMREEEFRAGMIEAFGEGAERWLSPPDGDEACEAVRQDFMDLFKVPLAAYTAPYEAVYRDERLVEGRKVRGLVMGPSTAAVQAIYRRAGVEPDKSHHKELPDHVSTELAFLALLCRREAEACKAGRKDDLDGILDLQREFLADHVLAWVPRLVERIRASAGTDFFRGIATLLARFLEGEKGRLKIEGSDDEERRGARREADPGAAPGT